MDSSGFSVSLKFRVSVLIREKRERDFEFSSTGVSSELSLRDSLSSLVKLSGNDAWVVYIALFKSHAPHTHSAG